MTENQDLPDIDFSEAEFDTITQAAGAIMQTVETAVVATMLLGHLAPAVTPPPHPALKTTLGVAVACVLSTHIGWTADRLVEVMPDEGTFTPNDGVTRTVNLRKRLTAINDMIEEHSLTGFYFSEVTSRLRESVPTPNDALVDTVHRTEALIGGLDDQEREYLLADTLTAMGMHMQFCNAVSAIFGTEDSAKAIQTDLRSTYGLDVSLSSLLGNNTPDED